MKRLLLIFSLLCTLLLPVQSWAVIAYVSTNSTTDSSGTVSTVSAGTYATGETLIISVVYFQAGDINTTITSLVDTGGVGNTYTATPNSPVRNTTQGYTSWIYYAKNITGFTGDITATFSETITFAGMAVDRVTGLATTTPFDSETTALSNSSTVPDPGAATLRNTNEYIVETSIVSGTDGVGTGFTSSADLAGNRIQHKIVSGGSWGASAFATANSNWLAQGASFSDTDAGGAPDVTKFYKRRNQ